MRWIRSPGGRIRETFPAKGLAANSMAQMSVTVLNSAFGYVFWIVAARAFDPSEVGAATAAISAATVAAVIAEVGLRTTLMEVLPGSQDLNRWSSAVSAAILLSLVTSTLASGLALGVLWTVSPQIRMFLGGGWSAIVFCLTAGLTLSLILDGISTAERRTSQLMVRSVLGSVVKLASIVIFALVLGHDPQVVLLATSLGLFAAISYGLRKQLHQLNPAWKPSFQGNAEAFQRLRQSMLGHYLINVGGWLPPFILPLEVVSRASTAANAFFSFTWLVGNIFFMVSPSVASSLFVQGRWEPSALASATRRAVVLITILLAPVGVVLLLIGHDVLGMFGSLYAENGYPVLVVLIISSVPDAITNVRIGQLRAQRRLNVGSRLNLAMAIIAIGSAWWLIPAFGITGAALSWLIAQSAGSVWVLVDVLLRRRDLSREVTGYATDGENCVQQLPEDGETPVAGGPGSRTK